MLRLAIPSDGELYEGALTFLRNCGMPVERASLRRYTANIPSLPGVAVLFQRTADITAKVEEGSADIGVVGLDRFLENRRESEDTVVLMEDLGFGQCELVVAVPDGWVDVTSMEDLADLSVEFRERGRELRIATKYPRLVQRYLYQKGLNYFSTVQGSGTLEAAPIMGYADIIGDISASGTTLRENHLKSLEDGVVLASQACLIGNVTQVSHSAEKLLEAKRLLELVEGHLRAIGFYSVTANIRGESVEDVGAYVTQQSSASGLLGPTISTVYTSEEGQNWYAVTIVVPQKRLLEGIEHLRRMGGSGISVLKPSYVFEGECLAYLNLLKAAGKEPPCPTTALT